GESRHRSNIWVKPWIHAHKPWQGFLPLRTSLLTGIGRDRMGLQIGPFRRAGEGRPPVLQRTESDRLPEVGHKVKVIADVVQGGEHRAGELAAAEQVVQEGPRGAG